ncbi:MAG: hypothetical protein D6816_15005, partial [Bacteroidetes bacterium]
MLNVSSGPILTDVTFSGNSATNGDGGGMYNSSNHNNGTLLTNVTFSGNSASTNGGGMYTNASSLTLVNITFYTNTASMGGGMYNRGSSPILTNVTFSDNSVSDSGGGMYNSSSTTTLTNVTFSGNSASNNGGGMSSSSSTTRLTNVTFSGNSATSGGGVYNDASGYHELTNVIIANSSGGDCSGSVSPGSTNNLVEDNTNTCGLTNNIFVVNIIGQDPVLGVLTDFGGPGKQVFPLLSGSPAVDAGTNTGCPATDQRGAARPIGPTCDIGAYEGIGFVWDGEGADNNWSTALNWTGDTVPGAGDAVFFNGTSSKNSVIDAVFGGAVVNVDISNAYTGTITFGRSLAVSNNYSQDGG